MKIYVVVPNYNAQTYEIRIVHYLMYVLRKLGHTVNTCATIFGDYPLLPTTITAPTDEDIVICTEMAEMVPVLSIDRPIFRWVLNKPINSYGDKKYTTQEIVYYNDTPLEISSLQRSAYGEATYFRLTHSDLDKDIELTRDILNHFCLEWVKKSWFHYSKK